LRDEERPQVLRGKADALIEGRERRTRLGEAPSAK
jgi:hypothetical protein